MNISGVVVRVLPEHEEKTIANLKAIDFCEYHMHEDGKIILSIEGENISEEIKILNQIKRLEHVISADVAYSYCEEELDEERELLDKNEAIPAWLNDEKVKAEQIPYNGDLKGKY